MTPGMFVARVVADLWNRATEACKCSTLAWLARGRANWFW
jgi:hypothetical protein